MNFYFEASTVLDQLDARRGSVKSILATLPEKNKARTAALVIETLKYKAVLSDVIQASKLLIEEKKKITSLNLALVLVHDVLFSGGIQAGDGPVKQAILRHKTRLRSEFQRIKIKRGVKSDLELAHTGDERATRIPRYVRVNTCLWTTEKAVSHYEGEGFHLSDPFNSIKSFSRDDHIPDLLLFNPHVQFHNDVCYKTGKIILQDKASCFPAIVMAPPSGDASVVIDATAAPGNKTSHLSALMNNKGKLYAFERDKRRYSTLKMMLAKAACRNVQSINMDFLSVDPFTSEYAQATHILLDPSCSGSGIVNRLDHLATENEESEEQEERLNKLANFQLMMLRHAMKFPNVQKIVYSTCSIHAIENERVVRQALKLEEALKGNFQLAPRQDVLSSWHRRGLPKEMDTQENASSLIRCSPDDDATNGFFVSCFIRTPVPPSPQEVTAKRRRHGETSPRKKKKRSNHIKT